jgi:hypothetical protein
MWRLYKTGIGLTTGFIGSHSYTQLQCIQFTIHYVHYNNCRVFSLCLHWLPVFLCHCVRSPSELTCNSATLLWRLLLHSHTHWTRPDSYTVVWRHYRNGPQRKQQFLPLLRCLATFVNKRFHVDCWPTACTSQYILQHSPETRTPL